MATEIKVEIPEERLRDLAKWSSEKAIKDLPSAKELRIRCRVELGLVTLEDIATLYDVTAETARRWVDGLQPVNPNRRPHLYRTDELPNNF